MSSIEDWRKSNLHKPQQPLPGLLSRLSIIPASERLPAPDDSALDTRSESSMGVSTGPFLSFPHELLLAVALAVQGVAGLAHTSPTP